MVEAMLRRSALLVLTLVAVLPLARADAAPGDVNRAWGTNGRVFLAEEAFDAAVGEDGSVLAVVYRRTDRGVLSGLVHVDPDGRAREVPGEEALAVDAVPGGFVVVVGSSAVRQPEVLRFDLQGAPDPTWGVDGRVVLDGLTLTIPAGAVPGPDGTLYLFGTEQIGLRAECATQASVVVRLTAAGALDTSFGSGGVVRFDLGKDTNARDAASGLAVRPDGGTVVGLLYSQNTRIGLRCMVESEEERGAVVALRPDGSADTSFGFNGILARSKGVTAVVRTAAERYAFSEGTVHGDPGARTDLVQIDRRGRPDPAFGANGTVRSATIGSLSADPAGRLYVSGTTPNFPRSARVSRFTAQGRADDAFGMCGTATTGGSQVLATGTDAGGAIVTVTERSVTRLLQGSEAPAAEVRTGLGTWVVARDGGVFTQGDALFCGSTGGMRLNQPVVGMTLPPSRNGYWFVAADGGVFSFGQSRFFGSTGSMRLNQPIVGMAATPTGNGYWLVARDGGVFSFGDARFHGSTGAIRLNQPIVGMAATPSGDGYWLVAADGGIFRFGDATFHGSAGGQRLTQPVVGMAATSTGRGYWLAARDGRVLAYGDAEDATAAERPSGGVVGIAAAPGTQGYYLATADGAVYGIGALFGGGLLPATAAPRRLAQPAAGIAGG